MLSRNNPAKRLLFNSLGLAISVIPVVAAILSYFPLWMVREDTSVLSGIAAILLCAALVPLYKYLGNLLRSPSAPLMWFAVFIVFLLLSKIANEMTVISFVGFTTNLIGSLFFKLAKRYGMEEDENEGRT
jgi:fumarate reductase subunit C